MSASASTRARCSSESHFARDGGPGPPDGPSGLPVGALLDRREVGLDGRVGGLGGPLGEAERGVHGARFRAPAVERAEGLEALEGLLVGLEAGLEGGPLGGHEGVEVGRAHELVLGPVDEGDESVEVRSGIGARVVEEREGGADVTQEEHLADPVEHVGGRGQPRIGGRLDQQPVAEAVEVANREAGPNGRPEGGLEAVAELLGRLHVVGQDEDLLWQQRTREGMLAVGSCGLGRKPQLVRVGAGRAALRLEQAAHPLDDDAGLAGPGAGHDDERAVSPVDDRLLLGGESVSRRQTHGVHSAVSHRPPHRHSRARGRRTP